MAILMQDLLGVPENALSVLPLDPTVVNHVPTLLQAQGAVPVGTSESQLPAGERARLWECLAELVRLQRCAWTLHMMREVQAAAAAAVEKLPVQPQVASVFQVSSWRAAHPQVSTKCLIASFQAFRERLV